MQKGIRWSRLFVHKWWKGCWGLQSSVSTPVLQT